MFPSRKEVEQLKKEMAELIRSHNELARTVFEQQAEINELKKPKEPEYFG